MNGTHHKNLSHNPPDNSKLHKGWWTWCPMWIVVYPGPRGMAKNCYGYNNGGSGEW